MRRLALLVALATLTWSRSAHATSSDEVTVKCPVCDNEFKADRCNSSNSFGGQDRDFCEHAAGGQVFILSCWTCPRCCYTGFPDDFDAETAPKELVAKLKKENPLTAAEPIDPKTEKSRKIPAWVRYDLLLQVLQLRPDTTAIQLATHTLRTAQTQRFDFDKVEHGDFGKRLSAICKAKWEALPEEKRDKYRTNRYDVDMTIGRTLEAEAGDPKSGLDDAARVDARFAAAFLFKSRGEDADAARVLSALAGASLPEDLKALADDIRARIERERKYRALAIPHFEKHLAEDKPEGEEATAIRYLLGVLYRRAGDAKKALTFLDPLLAEEGIPDGFKEWIKDEIAKVKAG